MGTAVLKFQIGSSQLAGTIQPTWQDPRRERGLYRTPKTDKLNWDITKMTSIGNSDSQISIRTLWKRFTISKKIKRVIQKKKKRSKYKCPTKLPSRKNVWIWWIQESLCLKLEILKMWVPGSSLDRIHEENMVSIGPEICRNDSLFSISHSIKKTKYISKTKTWPTKVYIM